MQESGQAPAFISSKRFVLDVSFTRPSLFISNRWENELYLKVLNGNRVDSVELLYTSENAVINVGG